MTNARLTTLFTSSAAALLVAFALVGCGGGGGTAQAVHPKTANGQAATVGVANTDLGHVLDNFQGRTLYLFQRDSGTTSACTGACAANWPPLRANGNPTVGSGATASMVSTIKRPDGSTQVSYNGHPLYRYQGDSKPGDTNGQGLTAFGGSWFALSPAGNQVSGTGTNSGGGGYGY